MTEYENIFDIKSREFNPSESLFGNSNSIQDNISDYQNDHESRPVRMLSDLSNSENDSAMEGQGGPAKAKSSGTRVKEVYVPATSNAVKRKMVNGTPYVSTDQTSEKSDRRIASETYKKIKEVEYRREVIYDKNGMVLNYDEDPNEYKKARKRIQNRESAIRARNRKKNYFSELEVRVEQLEDDNKRLVTENAALTAEKRILSEQLEYFKSLVGNNMGGVFSSKGSTVSHARDTNSQNESFDEEKDIEAEPNYEVKQGELPIIGNYQRPKTKTRIDTTENDRFVIARKDENSVSSTAGLFFLAIVMCVLCLTSLTLSGAEHGDSDSSSSSVKEFKLEDPSRHLMVIKNHEETICFFRIMIWIILT